MAGKAITTVKMIANLMIFAKFNLFIVTPLLLKFLLIKRVIYSITVYLTLSQIFLKSISVKH